MKDHAIKITILIAIGFIKVHESVLFLWVNKCGSVCGWISSVAQYI